MRVTFSTRCRAIVRQAVLPLGLVAVVFVLSGCSIRFNNANVDSTAGVFKSVDKTETWASANLFLHSGGAASIGGVNVLDIQFDPQDYDALYVTTENSGLLYSYDGAASWQAAGDLGSARIESVAIDPKNKCVVYATFGNTIRKSVDCNRSYSEMYIDTRADKALTALAVDSFNNLAVYAGNNAGDILKSLDGGVTWQVIHRLGKPIRKILIDPNDTRTVYIATSNDGIFKTVNAGGDWTDVNDGLRPYSGAFEYRDLFFDPTQQNSLLLVAKYGLLKTNDAGGTWEPFQLITPPASVDIFAAAINPQNNKEIFYATASTFYKTVDGGQNWITTRLPSAAIPRALLIDPRQPNVVYMGLFNPPK